jgi:hypothetical protein
MLIPPSPHFTPIDLGEAFNTSHTDLPGTLQPPADLADAFGNQTRRGIPFLCGEAERASVLQLAQAPTEVTFTEPRAATYLLFLHVVGSAEEPLPAELRDAGGLDRHLGRGNRLGGHVATYTIAYADGQTHTRNIERRFAIQQASFNWGASAMAAVPAVADGVLATVGESTQLGRALPVGYGRAEVRVSSGRDASGLQTAWIYALPNPSPDNMIVGLQLAAAAGEQLAIYAITTTQLTEHPLRPGTRRKAMLNLPDGLELNAADEIEEIGVDLGTVISARGAVSYDAEAWAGHAPEVQPQRSARQVLVEYVAHPQARLYLGAPGPDRLELALADLEREAGRSAGVAGVTGVGGAVAAAERPVHIRVVERGSSQPVAVRFHAHGQYGEYLPPKGYHRKVNTGWFEDNYAEFASGANQYAYIPGECTIDLPVGEVAVEISRGYEVTPLRTTVLIASDTSELNFELERTLDWRSRGWITADTHVHFLSPQTALLEGAAEGINVVNLLASQWGEMFSNVGDFDGRTTFGSGELGSADTPTADFLVRVGTENRMQVLGHISLLGYRGSMIQPLCSGGPSESALGDPQEVSMAQWAQSCIDQRGLVVMPHAPNPQCERAADIVLDLVHATEMMTFNPRDSQLNPYGITDWYRYLNLGYQLPVVGGSDKMAASSQLGGVRTYAHLGDREFTYENWMAAVKRGHTFVTVGPLVDVTVEGKHPGERLDLPAGGGTVQVEWQVESVSVPVSAVEVIVGGLLHETVSVNALAASGSVSLPVAASSWVAVRVRGSYHAATPEQIAAHTSAVQVRVAGARPWAEADADLVLTQIEGALAYVDTLAPRADAVRYRALRATLEAAHNRFHQMMHRHGVFHAHTAVHDHHPGQEH